MTGTQHLATKGWATAVLRPELSSWTYSITLKPDLFFQTFHFLPPFVLLKHSFWEPLFLPLSSSGSSNGKFSAFSKSNAQPPVLLSAQQQPHSLSSSSRREHSALSSCNQHGIPASALSFLKAFEEGMYVSQQRRCRRWSVTASSLTVLYCCSDRFLQSR